MDELVPILLTVDVQSKRADKCAVEAFNMRVRLHVISRHGEFFHCEDRTKRRKELAYKLGPIIRYQVVRYMVRDNIAQGLRNTNATYREATLAVAIALVNFE